MTLQIATWWLVIQAFGLAGLPLARFLFRALPDKGYALAKALGLLLVGYLAWLLAMLGLAPFGRGLLVVSGIVVAGIGLVVTRPPHGRSIERPDDRDGNRRDKRQETRDGKERVPGLLSPGSWLLAPISGGWLRENWKLVLGYEALFLVALVFVALLRSYNPHPWGTERPMA